MSERREYPPLSHSCVGMILYRTDANGTKQYLIQDRNNDRPEGTAYRGKIEFPVGILEGQPVNRIYAPDQALEEVAQETGMNITQIRLSIDDEEQYSHDDNQVRGFRPYYMTQQIMGGNPWYMTVFLGETPYDTPVEKESAEAKNIRWVDEEELKCMLSENCDAFFPLQVPAWKYHFKNNP